MGGKCVLVCFRLLFLKHVRDYFKFGHRGAGSRASVTCSKYGWHPTFVRRYETAEGPFLCPVKSSESPSTRKILRVDSSHARHPPPARKHTQHLTTSPDSCLQSVRARLARLGRNRMREGHHYPDSPTKLWPRFVGQRSANGFSR